MHSYSCGIIPEDFNCSFSNSGLAMAVTMWTHIRELSGSNLGWETNYHDLFCVFISSLPPRDCLDCVRIRFLSN
jgi:hypothetical protein